LRSKGTGRRKGQRWDKVEERPWKEGMGRKEDRGRKEDKNGSR
jgi:hypothetical protein